MWIQAQLRKTSNQVTMWHRSPTRQWGSLTHNTMVHKNSFLPQESKIIRLNLQFLFSFWWSCKSVQITKLPQYHISLISRTLMKFEPLIVVSRLFSGICCHVLSYTSTNVSKDTVALFYLEDRGFTIFQNIGTHLPIYMVSHSS